MFRSPALLTRAAWLALLGILSLHGGPAFGDG
jgi:hypothetical protein